jgi:Permuted papain-like amidase enzyme, YaeF/YiiX, C92 family
MKLIVLLALLLDAVIAFAASEPLRDGDVIFQTSRSTQSVAVQRATGSPYSHMGIVFMRGGQPYVFEAIERVQYTPLRKWVERGVGSHYVVKRLHGPSELDSNGLDRMRKAARSFEGKPYDLTFEWSDDRIYCSELVWKIYKQALGVEIGNLQKIKEFNLKDPAVRAKMRERYGTNVPLNEPAISPVAMFNSPKLETVLER